MIAWDRRFLALARSVATWSKDPSTKVGAVLVGAEGRTQIALGYNGFPPGIQDDGRLDNREVKYRLTQHAERNVLDNANFSCRRGTLYVTHHPCCTCAKSIITKGIARVVYATDPDFEGRWQQDIEWAKRLFSEVGVSLVPIVETSGKKEINSGSHYVRVQGR